MKNPRMLREQEQKEKEQEQQEDPKIFVRRRGRPRKSDSELQGNDVVDLTDTSYNPPLDQAERDATQRGMTIKQWLFCNHYANTLNVSRSATMAGYAKKHAYSRGAELLQKQSIRTEISSIQATRVRVLNRDLANKAITQERVLEELAYIAFFNPQECYADDGTLLPINEMSEPVARGIGTIEVREVYEGSGEDRRQTGVLSKMRPWDKLKAADMLMKYLGMFSLNINVNKKTEITHRVQIQQLQEQFSDLDVEDLEALAGLLQKASSPKNLDPIAIEEGKPPIDVTPTDTVSVLVPE